MTARIRVRLTPRGGRDEIEGWVGELLHVRVAAAPVHGEANDSLRRLLAKSLGIAPSRVSIIQGALGRSKLLEIDGIDAADVHMRLGSGDGA